MIAFLLSCAPDPGIAHVSQIETRSRGVAFLNDGETALVGMSGNACVAETSTGTITGDNDLAIGEEDVVHDALGGRGLVVGSAGVYEYGSDASGPLIVLEHVLQARFADDAIVVLHGQGGHALSWYEEGVEIARVDVPTGSSGLAVDRSSHTAFVVGDRVSIAGPEVVTTFEIDADLVAFDGDLAYVARRGDSWLRAIARDGSERWAVNLGGEIAAFDDLGTVGGVVVMLEVEGGFGEVVAVDPAGVVTHTTDTPSAADAIVVDEAGEHLAIVLTTEVHFFTTVWPRARD